MPQLSDILRALDAIGKTAGATSILPITWF